MGFKNLDSIDLIKKEKVDRHYPERGVKAFYISKYDPRMPHPRKLNQEITITSPAVRTWRLYSQGRI